MFETAGGGGLGEISLLLDRFIGARRLQGGHVSPGALQMPERRTWNCIDPIPACFGCSSDAEAQQGLQGVDRSTWAFWKSANERAPAPQPVRTSSDAGAPWVGSTNGSVDQGTGPLQVDAAIHITGT